jgi:hypothetical protein
MPLSLEFLIVVCQFDEISAPIHQTQICFFPHPMQSKEIQSATEDMSPRKSNKGEIPIDSVEAKGYGAGQEPNSVESTGIELRGDKEMVSLKLQFGYDEGYCWFQC